MILTDVVLGISRLLDKRTTAGRENLVLETICNATVGVEIHQELVQLLDALRSQADPIVKTRHRKFSHRDRLVATARGAEPLPGITGDRVRKVLAGISQFLNIVEAHYLGGHCAYDAAHLVGNAGDLVWTLKKAAAFDQLVAEGVVDKARILESEFRDA